VAATVRSPSDAGEPSYEAGETLGRDPPSAVGPFRSRRSQRQDPGPLRRLVFGRRATTTRSAAGRSMRRVRSRAAEPSDSLLLAHLPVEIPWTLLLGFRPVVRDVEGPVPVPDLWDPASGAGAGRRPHRGDRSRRSRSRIFEPADGLPTMPSSQDPSVPGRTAPALGKGSPAFRSGTSCARSWPTQIGAGPPRGRSYRVGVKATTQMYPDASVSPGRSLRASVW
jgi:hypothetical protein